MIESSSRPGPAFAAYFAGRVLSSGGSAVAPLATAFAALHLGGGASALGWVLAAGLAPQLVLLLIGGVAADRWSRPLIMVVSNLIAGGAQAVAAIAVLTGVARVWQLAAVAAVIGATSAFFGPAAQGVVPQLVPSERLQRANASVRLGQNVAKVAGPALGGLVVAAVGPGWGLVFDAATFVLAAGLFAALRVPLDRARGAVSFVADLRDGWLDFWSRRWLWVIVVQSTVVVACWLAGYQQLGPVYARDHLGGAAGWGLVGAALAGGLLTGSAVSLLLRPVRVAVAVCVGTGAMALPLAAMAAGAPLPVLLGVVVVTGVGLDVSIVTWTTVVQARIPAHRQARTSAYSTLGQLVLVPVVYLVCGPLVSRFGLLTMLGVFAVLIAAAAVGPMLVPQVRTLRLPGPDVDQPVTAPAGTDGLTVAARR
ncbi:MFS transporter [Dactylosporangium sp. NPDC005555]|uniref:MFS transporter n=1 Tax=Dactylosporangium sp. NPDC005555 TaxID=3154889 RepID=UPI0033AC394B